MTYKMRVTPPQRTVTPGAKVAYRVYYTQDRIYATGSPRETYEWYYYPDRDVKADGTVQARTFPGRWRAEVERTWDKIGKFTVGCKITDPGAKPKYLFHNQWVEETDIVLGREIAAANQEGLPDIYSASIMAFRYKQVLQNIAAKHPPTGKAKEAHDAQIKQLGDYSSKCLGLIAKVGIPRIKINTVHIEKTTQRMSRLRVFVAPVPGKANTWMLIDWTNPLQRTQTGFFERSGSSDADAIKSCLGAFNSGNRYPDGQLQYVRPPEYFQGSEGGQYKFETDGSSTWDSVASFFEWIALGAAVVAGVVTLVAPVPGSRVASAAIWTSIFSSTAAATINIAQRREEGFGNWKADALDGLTIVGNLFAGGGMWAKGATVLTKNAQGKIVKMTLIGQVGTDGVQGVLLAHDLMKDYDRIMSDRSLTPKERADKLLELFRSAAIAGTMTAISLKGTKDDLANMRKKGLDGQTPAEKLQKLKDPNAELDLTHPPKADGDTKAKDGQTTKTQDDHRKPDREDASYTKPKPPAPKPPRNWKAPPPAAKRGMRDMDDKIFAAKAKKDPGQYIFVRDGNPDGVQFIGKNGVDANGKPFTYEGKPMEMKAKTATEGPYKGVVCFDPTHARTHNTLAKLPGHPEKSVADLLEGKTVKQLMADPNSEFRKRYDYFKKKKIEDSGFKVIDDDNYVVAHAQTNARYHGDYDLHGVYTKDGAFVSDTSKLRGEINDEMGSKLIQHGAHDEWPDRQNPNKAGENAGPQPPVTVYTPDGRKVWLGGGGSKEADRKLFKQFFEEHGLQWRYDDWEALPGNKIDTGN